MKQAPKKERNAEHLDAQISAFRCASEVVPRYSRSFGASLLASHSNSLCLSQR